jgi:hypothetical protein
VAWEGGHHCVLLKALLSPPRGERQIDSFCEVAEMGPR